MFKKYQLKNGMRVLLVESHKSPVLSIQMWVKTGSADEKKGEEGISHFIEHLVFKGTRKYKVGEIASAVEAAGGELNAYTSFDQTVFYVTISKEFQKVGLDVISEMMGFPHFDAKEIDNEREVVIEEIKRSHDSPHRQASRALFSSVYKKHPYGIPVIGYEDNIKNVSRDVLVSYFEGRYNPKTMTLVVAGDFKSAEMRKQIEQHFAKFKPSKLRVVKRAPVVPAKKPSLIIQTAPFNETIVHMAFPIPKATHKDIAALEVFALILGQGESSRLNQRLRLKDHAVNFAGSSVFVARDPGFFALSMSLNEKDLAKALDAMVDEVGRALSAPPSAQELEKARTNLTSEQYYHLETVDGLARNFGHYQDLFGDPSYFDRFMKQVRSLKVNDVLKAARKYLNADQMTFVVMSPAEKEKIEKTVQEGLRNLQKTIKRQLKGKPALTKEKAPPKISWTFKKSPATKTNAEKWTLDNGVTVITRPNFETPVINMRCASLGGSRLEGGTDRGAAELLSRTWTSGAGSLSEFEMSVRIDEMAASLSAFAGRNSQGLSMSCLRPFEKNMLDLFFTTLLQPAFESDAIAREKKSMIEHVKLRQDNPGQTCILEFMRTMFGDHPYGHDPYGDEASINQLTPQKVRELFNRRKGLTIVASGAFDPKEFREQVKNALGGTSFGQGKIETQAIKYPDKEVHVFRENPKQQSHLIVGYPGLDLKSPDRYVLQVMQAILAGQGGRLFVELRDKASLAYSVSPMRMEGLEGGYFGAYIGCSPEKAQTAIRMMHEEFDKLVDKLVPADELLRAQRYLIGKHDIELQKNSSLTSSILFDFIYGIDFMETYKYTERIRAVKSEDIRRLAESIFSKAPVKTLVGPVNPWETKS
jgi:zinc protease